MTYDNIDDDQAARVAAWIAERSYSDDEIRAGLAYAAAHGGGSDAEVATLALSRILFTDDQLADGGVFIVHRLDQ